MVSNAVNNSKVLVVDDEPIIRKVLRKTLMLEGYECKEASTADEAISELDKNSKDIVIMDVMMPGKSGREALSVIREKYPDTAVIMLTAVADTSTVVQCMKEGAKDYLVKPLDPGLVINSVEKALQIRELELELKHYQQNLESQVEEQTREIRKLFLGAIESLVNALEAKDKYTAGHSKHVTEISMLIGKALRLSEEEQEDLRIGALLHDVGKIAVDPAIQNKAGRLSEAEYDHIMTHVQIGPKIVKSVANNNVLNIIQHHHARFDGKGHNDPIKGTDIPLGARIVAIADTFDAMTSNRPYRDALGLEKAFNEINRCSGTQFDPVLVEVFNGINNEILTWALSRQDERIEPPA